MKRIYLESLLGLILLFMLTVTAYEVINFEFNTDYDYLLEDYQSQALVDTINTISEGQSKDEAIEALQHYADSTRLVLTAYDIKTLPYDISQHFSSINIVSQIHYDSKRKLWFKIIGDEHIYSLSKNDNAPVRKAIDFSENILWVYCLVGFALYCVCLIWFISRRVRALEAVTVDFSNGDFNARASLKSSITVGSLNKSFNTMADKIAALITSNKSLTNAVAHEIRTPIFRIQWQAEVLSETKLDPEQQRSVQSIIEDTEEMDTMVEELLYYARVEQPEVDINPQSIDLANWLPEQVTRWTKETDIPINMSYPVNSSQVTIDPYLIKRALDNLIRNAYRYAQSKIELNIVKEDNNLIITVEDDGVGVELQHWPYIFDAFYSASSSRNKQYSGHGLGLAIVKQIILRHQGEIKIEQSRLGGALFHISLPISHG